MSYFSQTVAVVRNRRVREMPKAGQRNTPTDRWDDVSMYAWPRPANTTHGTMMGVSTLRTYHPFVCDP